MNTSTPIIDIHIHPTLKPFGNSFYDNTNPRLVNDASCIWAVDRATEVDKTIENTLGISRYRQSDFKTLVQGQVKVCIVSLYPVEKQFIKLKNPNLRFAQDFLAQFASLLGKKRIDVITHESFNYFEDLKKEHHYLTTLNNQAATGGSHFYTLVQNNESLKIETNLLVIPSIEGCHCFCEGNNTQDINNWKNLDLNVLHVKNWDSPPMFVTMAHHFYNGLCTHAKSLFETSGKLLDQSHGMRDYNINPTDGLPPISEIGYKLIDSLLSQANGKRILIDVKHMSKEARNAFYQYLEKEEYINEKIPVICSHGALNIDTEYEINLNFEDIRKIYKTKGLIGIEIDQRILGYNEKRFKKWLGRIFKGNQKECYEDAFYFWRQIINIAEYAYKNNLSEDPWECICLGSDYDGVINPLNRYRDASTLSVLYQNLIIYLEKYWEKDNPVIPKNHSGKEATDVIYNIMYKNAYSFIERYYAS
ncbi:membrane dipeptidase [Flavobacterium terrisoli]|uniref:membrane dipeptidase n=1 Tax=Flavobacterium terrisoli TaxID=3242195 RepID=UPI002543DE31|nr:membrane dipeptidase [Flavobacterium buctense]